MEHTFNPSAGGSKKKRQPRVGPVTTTGATVELIQNTRARNNGRNGICLLSYVHRLNWYQPESGIDLILDRSFYSENVYGPIWRQERHAPEILEACEAWALAKGAVVVYLDETDDTLVQRVTDDIEDDPDASNMDESLVRQYAQLYRQQAPTWKLPTVTFPPGYNFYPDPAINHAEVYSRLAKEAQ